MEKDDKWINKLREEEYNYKTNLPDGLWEEIEKNLPGESHATIALWRRYSAVAAAIIALIGIGITLIISLPGKEISLGDKPSASYGATTISAAVHTEQQTSANPNVSIINTPKVFPAAKLAMNQHTQSSELPDLQQPTINDISTSYLFPDSSESEAPATTPANEHDEANHPNIQPSQSDFAPTSYNIPLRTTENNVGKLHIGGFANTGIMINKKNPSVNFTSPYPPYSPVATKCTYEHHKIPVKFGASFDYALNRYLSIESGLYYSILSSELEYDDKISVDQSLGYIGIPVKINCNIWSNSTLRTYAGAGIQVEKCITGTAKCRDYSDSKVVASTHSVTEKQLQASIMASAGIQLNLTKELGIYAEPGVAYYFDNGSEIRNVYKYHQVAPDVKVGLRFTLK